MYALGNCDKCRPTDKDVSVIQYDMQPKKLIITGGHVTPALAVIDALRKTHPETEIVFVGRRFNNNRENSESFEYKEIKRRSLPFYHLVTGRLTRSFSLQTLQNLFAIPFGFFRSWQILRTESPDTVLSFGGYLALPIAMVASWMGIPVFTHEQTIHPGLANQKIASVASKVFVSFPESLDRFPKEKAIVTGNPIRESIFKSSPRFALPENLPCIYVTGGSLGAHALNVHIEHILSKLLENYIVIHQTGNLREYNDYDRLSEFRRTLSKEQQERYIIKTHVEDDEIGPIYDASDVVVSRSGANTFFELIALKKPAVLIPLPLAAFDEQRKHAQILKDAGAAEVFEQDQESEDLLLAIKTVLEDRKTYERKYQKLEKTYITEGVERILEELY